MKNVLFIAYYFPPLGGAGVQRSLKYVKYLRDYGWNPVILTVKEDTYGIKDYSLLEELPLDINIYRTKPYAVMHWWSLLKKVYLQKIPSFIDKYLLLPDGQVIWQYKARSTAIEIIKKHRISHVYTTSGPYSSHMLGNYIKDRMPEIKWIVDFRDQWTTKPTAYLDSIKNNKLRFKIEHAIEKKVCSNADKIVVISEAMRSNLSAHNDVPYDKFCIIPNGFDPADFTDLRVTDENRNRFVITYSGSFYGFQDPSNFMRVIRELIDEKIINEEKISLRFVGNTGKLLDDAIFKYGLEEITKKYGYMSHLESLNILYSSDVLLLIIGSGPNTDTIYTGKIFEYAKVNKPIIALIPPNGIAAEFIRSTNTGLVANIDDIEASKRVVASFYNDYFKGKLTEWKFNHDEIDKFNRAKLTGKLSDVLDDL